MVSAVVRDPAGEVTPVEVDSERLTVTRESAVPAQPPSVAAPPRDDRTRPRARSRARPQQPTRRKRIYTGLTLVYTAGVTKRLVDIDDQALAAAQVQLGTRTIKDTVNMALTQAGADSDATRSAVLHSFDVLSAVSLGDHDRADAWR